MVRLVTVHRAEFDPLESQNICFKPTKNQTRLRGVLVSPDASLSIALKNGTDHRISEFEFFYRDAMNSKPPNERILKLDEPLDDCTITGIVTNTKDVHHLDKPRTISVYLLLEENE